MSQPDRELILREVIKRNGHQHQIMIAMEEMGELIKALSKAVRYSYGEEQIDGVIEEAADVMIMIRQVMIMTMISDKELEERIEKKILRLAADMELSMSPPHHKCDTGVC